MNEALSRLAEACRHVEASTNKDNVGVLMSVEDTGIKVSVYFELDGRRADAGRLVSYADIEGLMVNPLISTIDAALNFVGAEP